VSLPLTDERPAAEADAAGIADGALASDRLSPLTGVRVLVIVILRHAEGRPVPVHCEPELGADVPDRDLL